MSELVDELVSANHVLANEGVIRGFGHVSAREPGADTFRISRSRSPRMVEPEDVLEVTLDGEVLDGDPEDTYLETVIHRAIYRHRDDVGAVVHHHADEVMAYACSSRDLRPIFRRGAQFHDGIPRFADYDDHLGDLVATEAEADRMAASLGECRAQLLESHGANVVGDDVRRAVISTLDLRMNARYQYWAEQVGEPRYHDRSPEAVASYLEALFSDSAVGRKWEYLLGRLEETR